MALSKKIQEAINEQINKEFFSANLYLAMSSAFAEVNLNGFANWMRIQYIEETFHALKFYDFVLERGGSIELKTIQKPELKSTKPIDIFSQTYEHEQLVTASINSLMKLARSEDDYATESYLKWFIDEQVEEESNASNLLERLKIIGEDKSGLFMLDTELAQRVLSPTINLVNTSLAAN